jgi:hypothetical protein
MGTITVTEGQLAAALVEIFARRGKLCRTDYSKNLAHAVFAKVREQNDKTMKDLLGLEPLCVSTTDRKTPA